MGETQGFKVRAGVILPVEDKILLVRQNGRDFWVFPGGTLEPGESLAECAVRELQEEVNLTISIEKLLYLADFITPQRQVVDAFFLGHYESGTLRMTEDENLDEIGLFSWSELQMMKIAPDLVAKQVIKEMPQGFRDVSNPYLGKYGSIVK